MTTPAVDTGIVAFIEARLKEREVAAQAALAYEDGDDDGPRLRHAVDYLGPELADHIARNSPLRVSAEVAKDRAILALHRPDYVEDLFPSLAECTECEQPYPCQTVRLLAATDADHPAYREDWKPQAS